MTAKFGIKRIPFICYHEFRGAQVSDQIKKLLDEFGGYILREAGIDFEKEKDYDWITNLVNPSYAGYTEYYLQYLNWNDSKGVKEVDAVLQRLVHIDSNLGTKASKLLFCCLQCTTQSDIIKVGSFLN